MKQVDGNRVILTPEGEPVRDVEGNLTLLNTMKMVVVNSPQQGREKNLAAWDLAIKLSTNFSNELEDAEHRLVIEMLEANAPGYPSPWIAQAIRFLEDEDKESAGAKDDD